MRPRCPARDPDLVAAQPQGQGLDRLQGGGEHPPSARRLGVSQARDDEADQVAVDGTGGEEEHGQQHTGSRP